MFPHQTHSTLGTVDGHAMCVQVSYVFSIEVGNVFSSRYGIKNIRVVASSARVVVQDCLEAEGSTDARDKFFMYVVALF